jgi:hypothetical protein
MSIRDHYEGFEKERKFHMVLGQAACDCPLINARTVRRIIAHFDPEFVEEVFKIRPCVRKLKYVGCGCAEKECSHGDKFFKQGNIYESIDFNGATYTIKGYNEGKSRIGLVYFEWI